MFGLSKLPKAYRLKKSIVKCGAAAEKALIKESEYYEEAPYPPIKEYPTKFRQHVAEKKQTRYNKIKNIETIEEKMIEINMPRYYGFKTIMLNDTFPYNSLPNIQYYTNTELVEEKSMIDGEDNTKIDQILSLIKSEVIDAFEFEIDGYK
jgi:small subunit ribosomal protein S30